MIIQNPFLRFEDVWFARSRLARFLSVFFPFVVSAACLVVFLVWEPRRELDPLSTGAWEWKFLAALMVSQALMVGFLAPLEGLARGLREKGTLDLLVISPVPARTLFLGLLGGASIPIIFLVTTTAPVALLILILGNIPAESLGSSYLVILFLCVSLSSFGLYMSLTPASPATAWMACMGLGLALFLFAPLLDGMVYLTNYLAPIRIVCILAVTVGPAVWALVCSVRGKGAARVAGVVAFFMLLILGGAGAYAGIFHDGKAVFSVLCAPAALSGEGFEELTGMDMPDGAIVGNLFYLAGLSLLFTSAAYIRIERMLDRRPFHER